MEIDDFGDIDDEDILQQLESLPSTSLSRSRAKNEQDSYKTWVEKYRPSKLDEVVYQNEIVQTLQHIIAKDALDLPNFLFYGPPGTGKTSTIIALSKQLFNQHYSKRVLELNASDERGIQVIRDKVKNFAQQTVAQEKNIPSLKVIVLDECDSMTKDAQSALRRIMEKFSSTTRFCLICNYVSKIIDPIISRCSIFRFKPLQPDLIKKTLTSICQKEKFEINDQALETLIEISDGDLRRSITLLQSISLISEAKEISSSDLMRISGVLPTELINKFFNSCRSKSHEPMMKQVGDILKLGYSGAQFLSQLQHWIATADENLLSDQQKSKICERIAINDKRLLDGGDEYLQLLEIGSCIINVVH